MGYPQQHLESSVVWFNAFDPTGTSYVYDHDGGTSVTAGKVPTDYHAMKAVFISVAVLNSTSLTVQIEGMPREFDGGVSGQTATWFALYRHTFTTADTQVVSFSFQPITHMRVGVKVAGNVAGDSVSIAGGFSG